MNILSRQILIASALLGSLVASAAEPTIADALNNEGTITVVQPSALNERLQILRHDADVDDQEIVDAPLPKIRAGYRVQVFDDNNVRSAKNNAQACKNQLMSRFPDYPVYVSFNSPYWRVKLGDFKTRGEAEAAMAEIRHAFPAMAKSLRIVRDRINQ